MKTVRSADGIEIAYEKTGHGPPMVLVHGTTADHTRWEPIRSALEEHFTLYAIDRRGRGESGDAPEYSLEREVEDVVAVVDSIGEPVVLLGHSYGALCSLEAALHTENVSKLVLYEPPFSPTGQVISSHETLEAIQALVDRNQNEQALVRFFEDVAGMPPAEVDVLRRAPNWPDRVAAAHTIAREEAAPDAYEFDADRLAALTMPTLLLTGSESAPFLREATATLAETLPNSRIVTFEGHGHVAINSAPDEFVDAVLTFVRESESVPRAP
ncbi:alpha/beta fold hydrolase [Haladaptatus sp. GCM10025707]|uniref:alpha/beta fold hydrolase n=1 Tax=unclassified Haladaptatus TaxID=2622732 RepID=UPI0023E7F812|nr:alpha/beta hydrolase [Haladaptatus sp. QDMS2]